MKINANAKINLALDVTGKRDDGYHEVCMILQEIDLCDTLEIALTDDGEIHLSCDGLEDTDKCDNLAYKAARLFLDYLGSKNGCNIKLTKNIPVGAGLAGGSADAAAVLKALNSLFKEPFGEEKLKELGLRLGADVPFCIMGGTALGEGIGEKLNSLYGMMPFWAALIKPEKSISTKEAYHKIDSTEVEHPDVLKCAKHIKQGEMEELFGSAGNVFEYVAKDEIPEIDDIKSHFISKGALFSMMSGSGPTVFGLFDDENAARKALESFSGVCECRHLAKIITD